MSAKYGRFSLSHSWVELSAPNKEVDRIETVSSLGERETFRDHLRFALSVLSWIGSEIRSFGNYYVINPVSDSTRIIETPLLQKRKKAMFEEGLGNG